MINLETVYISLIVLAYIGAMVVMLIWFKKRRQEREKKDTEFVNTLVEAFYNDAIQSIEDVKDMLCGFYRIKYPDDVDITKVALFLRRVKHVFSTKTLKPKCDRNELLAIVNSIIVKSDEALKAEKRRIPFAGVPSEQRSLLEDILVLSAEDEKSYVRDKLEKLASIIRSREDTVNRLSDEKGKSLKWAKWGVAGTVVFSLISIGLAIWK